MNTLSTASRVTGNTDPLINERIERDTQMRVRGYASQPRPAISVRLNELEDEWDIERFLETGASSLILAGLVLGSTVSKKWLLLPTAVAGFFLQHSLQGWCPPLPLLRALGVRTAEEINRERYALKALRGDFEDVSQANEDERAAVAIEAANF